MKDCVVALDLGTTGNRAIVFDKRLRILASAYQEFHQYFPRPGWVEHDPEEIWRSTRNVLTKVLRRVGASRVAAIGITNQRETVVLWNRHTGKSPCKAIVWQDRRTADVCERLKKQGWSAKIRAKTGLTLDPYFSATKIQWLLRHHPLLAKQAKAGDIVFGTVDSWILWKLTSGRVHATDVSNASRTLLFNINTLRWDKGLFRLFHVPRDMAPLVKPTGGEFGVTDVKSIGAEIPILAVLGDQQAALFGQNGTDPSVVKNTYGTGLFLLKNTGTEPARSKDLISTVAWQIAGKTHYALEGSVFIGGALIQWLRDSLGFVKSASESEALAQKVSDNGGVVFVPAFAGLGAPYWDSGARGLLIGLTRGTTKAHITRAALEALALQTKDTVDAMVRATGQKIRKLCVDGGASSNNFLMQLQADILDVPVERPKILETTALGVAGVAGIKAGLWRNVAEFIAQRQIDRIFLPKMRFKERDHLIAQWQRAVQRSRGWLN